MPESLENQFISDLYTSLLHLSGAKLENKLNKIFDGAGNSTGLALSGDRVIVNNYIYPRGYATAVEWLDAFWPVGSIKLTFNDQNPGDYLQPPRSILTDQDTTNFPGIAGTRWDQVAQGRFLVGVGEDEVKGIVRDFCPGGKEEEAAGLRIGSGDVAGEYEVELEEYHLPAHNHQTNTGAQDTQVEAEVGTGVIFQGEAPGGVDSTQSFDQQVRARNALLNNVVNFVRRLVEFGPVGATGLNDIVAADFIGGSDTVGGPGMIGSIMYGLDLGFNRGSSRNYSSSERSKFETVEGYKSAGGYIYQNNDANWPNFKEMIGIWNGETRFVADISSVGQRRGVNPDASDGFVVPERANPYTIARQFGAVDYDDAVVGQFLSQHNQMQTTAGDVDAIDRVEGNATERASTFVGDNEPHNNIPPSYGVYIWKRVQ
tara:strand:- start:7931 stop:9217 length:1287 start_codon:yes stop_codon:yes gene_type:complete